MKPILFTKMHGLGNDFVVIDDRDRASSFVTSELARAMLDRRFGVGGDQLLWLKASRDESCHARMDILNADGSVAEMCGNGIRCVALLMARGESGAQKSEHSSRDKQGVNHSSRDEYRIETLAGVKTVTVQGNEVRVDMGAPVLGGGFAPNAPGESPGESIELNGRELRFYEVSMGNPHAILFVNDQGERAAREIGPRIETLPRFPKRTNVEFVQITGPSSLRVDVWERGAGITLACGTGACASAVAALATGRVKGEVEVTLPGGRLRIDWPGDGKPVFMTGPAVEVFRGEWRMA